MKRTKEQLELKSKIEKEAEDKLTKLFEQFGAFFAFSNEQFDKQKKEGVKYVNYGAGLLLPKENVDKFTLEFNKITDWKIEELKKIDPEIMIEYELSNHEAYYTGEIEDAFDSLKQYGFTIAQVRAVYKKTKHKYEDQ